MKRLSKLHIGLLALFLSTSVKAVDVLELDETTVQGASELPKVLYIVPWKKSVADNKPIKLNSLVDDVMSPIDRDVLRRQVQYHEQATE